MAMRSLATRMATPAASALRRRPGPGVPPAPRSQFLRPISSQNVTAIRRFSFDMEFARETLETSKKQEAEMRRGIKRLRIMLKAMKWTCYFGVSASLFLLAMATKGIIALDAEAMAFEAETMALLAEAEANDKAQTEADA